MEETKFQEITITPIRRTEDEPLRYSLQVDGYPEYLWTTPGIYDSPEGAIASFTPPLRVEYQQSILNVLRDGKTVRFSLKDAYTSL